MPVPYTFGSATSAIPLSQLDSNFATTITLGNTAIQLGNTVTTLNNMTLANVTVSSGNVTITNATITNANVTTTTTLSGLTASTALALDASKNVVSVTNTGTGNNVLATSPTLTTPNLGTPSAVTLTNGTGLPLSTGVTGTLAVANGGTGQTSYTDGQLLIGNTATGGLSKATLTAGSNVTITNGNGTITIAATGGGSSQWTTSGSNIYFDGSAALRSAVTTVSQGKIFEVGFAGTGISSTSGTSLDLTNNAYYNSGWKYGQNGKTARIQLSDDQIYFFNATTGTAGNAITFTQTLAIQQGKTLALEGASLQTGTGITFPATQSASSDANTLDDYEEGTWTPVLQDSGGSQATMTTQQGFYTKVGNVVYAWCQIVWSSKTAMTGSWYAITGLPFTAKANTGGYYYGGVVQSDTSTSDVISLLAGGESKFIFSTSNSYTLQQVSALSASGRIIVTATYVV